jgi:hypothetical protein
MQLRFLSEYEDSNGVKHFIDDEIEDSELPASDLNLLLRFGAIKPISRADLQALQERIRNSKEAEKAVDASNASGLVSVNTATDAELEAVGFGAAAIRRIKGKRPYVTLDAVKVESSVPEDKWAEFALRLSL